jgi:DNA-binding transcriptional LysR family regulator
VNGRTEPSNGTIEIRHLRYFLEIAKEGNLTTAAQNLDLKQPPLSRQMSQLENSLGITLFQRRPRGVALTPAGKRFRKEAEAAVQRFDAAIRVARELPQYVHVGYAPSPTDEFRDDAIATLEQQLPNIRFIRHDYSVADCIRKIAQRELEFALTVEPHGHRLRSLRFKTLVRYPLMCAVALSHPYANRKYIRVAELSGERLLSFSRRTIPQYLRDIRSALEPHGLRPRPAQEYDGIDDLLPAVRAGHGVALLLRSAQRRAGKRVKFLSLKPAVATVPVGIVYNAPADKLMRQIVRILEETVPRLVRSRRN